MNHRADDQPDLAGRLDAPATAVPAVPAVGVSEAEGASASAAPRPSAYAPVDPDGGPAEDEAEAADGARHREDDDAPGAVQRRRRKARSAGGSLLRETAIIVVSALVLSWIVKTLFVQAFFIPSSSMHDTLVEDDRIMVSKLTPGPFDLERGDIVVFRDPGGWLDGQAVADPGPVRHAINEVLMFVGLYPQDAGEHLVKRVIGLPGDHVACAGPGEPVTVNGVALDEPYLAAGANPSDIAFDATVPEGGLWVMGDNRAHSADSRYNQGKPGGGSIPVDNVVGKAFVTLWPLDRAQILHNPGETFEDVPDPS